MFEIIRSGGWLMLPLLACSVLAAAIILERLWSLQEKRVLPQNLSAKVWDWVARNELNDEHIETLRDSSALGEVLAAALANRQRDLDTIKERVQDTGRHVVHELERFINTLGTIAAISPLLGLLGTVVGMIKVFAAITTHGVGDPTVLAGGISEALITTAAGLTVAIPALIGYRYLRSRIDSLVVQMEKEAIKLVDRIRDEHEAGRYEA
ncbi:MAG: MotA/TolQ/ExbB proton channel family protein [Gammaproteobacteria bacterium]|nr:MotA/TolQ/ExbB proton channel family protein [Gammaproteobacteria bacterium]